MGSLWDITIDCNGHNTRDIGHWFEECDFEAHPMDEWTTPSWVFLGMYFPYLE